MWTLEMEIKMTPETRSALVITWKSHEFSHSVGHRLWVLETVVLSKFGTKKPGYPFDVERF